MNEITATIVFEQMARAGSGAQYDAPIAKLDGSIIRTADATTSTTPETLTLSANTKVLVVNAVEDHRLSVESDTTTNYYTVKAGVTRDFGVDGGETVTYRADA